MSVVAFDAFRAELAALYGALASTPARTLRDDTLRERFRTLYRVWVSSVSPELQPMLSSRRDLSKLAAELQMLASLTARIKRTLEYRKRLGRAIQLANSLILCLPAEPSQVPGVSGPGGQQLFLPGLIPDVPISLVPNALIGWRGPIQAFLLKHHFDKSVFIMIRYRKHNIGLISAIKRVLQDHGLTGILASEHSLTDDLYNPIACMLCCARGVAVFDGVEAGQVFNPNVAYELGMMHLLGRECRLLKHKSLNVLHTDILMKLYHEYATASDAKQHLKEWLDGSGL